MRLGFPQPCFCISTSPAYYVVDTIHTAVQEKRRIRFQYIEYTAEKEKILKHDGYRYEFSPYALIWSRDYYSHHS